MLDAEVKAITPDEGFSSHATRLGCYQNGSIWLPFTSRKNVGGMGKTRNRLHMNDSCDFQKLGHMILFGFVWMSDVGETWDTYRGDCKVNPRAYCGLHTELAEGKSEVR